MRRVSKEYWVKNVTEMDLLISDLNLKIPANRTVNVYKLNPKLKLSEISESEEEGNLYKCFSLRKLLKLPCAPILAEQLPTEIKESRKSIPSRTKSVNILNIKELDFIEELSENFDSLDIGTYENYEDGVFDPMIESIPINSDGTERATVINSETNDDIILEAPHISDLISTETQQIGIGDSKYFTVRTLK